MRAYSMPYQAVMDMPVRAFWFVSGSIDRLMFYEAKLNLEVTTAGQAPEAAKELYERLDLQAPEPVILSGYAKAGVAAVRDEAGFAALRQMAG